MRFARLFGVVLLLSASAVSAQVVSANGALASTEPSALSRHEGLPIENNTYGTSALTYLTLTAWDFHPVESDAIFVFDGNPPTLPVGIYLASGSGTDSFIAPIHLPAGASISTVEVHACDTSSSNHLSFNLVTQTKTGPATVTLLGNTTAGAPPGCALFTFALSPSVTIDNDNNFYIVDATFGVSGPTLYLSSARVGYKLQISPDPPTATFTDVPVGSLYHRFVEALVAAGITGGCGGGNYCPDAPVTRGQIAVFLSAALGLHWAP